MEDSSDMELEYETNSTNTFPGQNERRYSWRWLSAKQLQGKKAVHHHVVEMIQVTDTDNEDAVKYLKRLIPTDKFRRNSEVYTIT
jgi:hypothetical protein